MQLVSLNLQVQEVLVYSSLHVPQSLLVVLLFFFDIPLPLLFLLLPILNLVVPQLNLLIHLSQRDLGSFVLAN